MTQRRLTFTLTAAKARCGGADSRIVGVLIACIALVAAALWPNSHPRFEGAVDNPIDLQERAVVQAAVSDLSSPERVSVPSEKDEKLSLPENSVSEAFNHSEQGPLTFLPFPNEGASAFAARYEGKTAAELRTVLDVLRVKVDEEARELLKERLLSGDVSQRVQAAQAGTMEFPNAGSEPVGMGRVWACTQVDPGSSSHLVRTAYLTEAQDPRLFAHVDEILWLVTKARDLEKNSDK